MVMERVTSVYSSFYTETVCRKEITHQSFVRSVSSVQFTVACSGSYVEQTRTEMKIHLTNVCVCAEPAKGFSEVFSVVPKEPL